MEALKDNSLNIIRISDAAEIFGCTRVTIWRMEKRGDLPPRRKFNERCVGWLEKDFKEFLESRPYADPEAEQQRQSESKTVAQ
jgi:predicted DNA-binding transcriptional regulator AlpA